MDIKKDKKGMVVIQGAEIKAARNSKDLMALFEEGSVNRHTACTSKLTHWPLGDVAVILTHWPPWEMWL